MFAALGIGVLPVLLAFKKGTAGLDEFKASISELAEPFKEIGAATLQTLRPGLEAAVTSFQKFIPMMSEFGAVQGEVIGNIAAMASSVLTSSSNLDLWRESLSEIPAVFKNLGAGVVGVADALPTLFASAMPIAQQFSESLGLMGQKFGDFIKETGKAELTSTFQGWYDAAAQVFRILGDVALGLFRILKIGSESTGQSMFDKFEEFTKKFENWTKSVKGNNAIKDFFGRSRKVMHEVGLILGDIGKALFGPIKGAAKSTSVVGTLESIRQKWIPPLKEIIEQVRTAGNLSFDNVIDEIGRFLDVLSENPQLVSTALSSLSINMGVFTTSLKILNTVLGSGVGQALFNFFAPIIPLMILAKKMKIAKLGADIAGLARGLDSRVTGGNFLGRVKGQLDGVGMSIVEAKGKFKPFQTVVAGVASAFGGYMAGMAKDTGTMVAGIAISLAGVGSALARGDWIGAGVAAVAGGVGFIVGRWQRGQKEAEARAEAVKKKFREIRDQVNDIFKGAFEGMEGGASKKNLVPAAFQAIRDSIDKGVDGAKTFSRAFHTSNEEVVNAMQGTRGEWNKFREDLIDDEIQRVMEGNATSVSVWADAMKEAGGKANDMIQDIQWQDLDVAKNVNASGVDRAGNAIVKSLKGTIDTVHSLGDQLASGEISWDEFESGALAAGASITDLTGIQDAYNKSLKGTMQASDSWNFIKTLQPELRGVANEMHATAVVNEKLRIEQEKMKPTVQRQSEALQKHGEKVKELADNYVNLVLQHQNFEAEMAGGALGVIGNMDTIFGNAAEEQEGLGDNIRDNLQRTIETSEAHTQFAKDFTAQAQEMVRSGKGTYADLTNWAEGYRTMLINARKQAGLPVSDEFLNWVNDVTSVDTNVAFDMKIISELNGAPESPTQIAKEQEELNAILKISDKKEFNSEYLHWVQENGNPSPYQQMALAARTFNQDLAGNNGVKAQTNAFHLVQENSKGHTQKEITAWAAAHGVALKNIDKARADTATRHEATENKVKKSQPEITLGTHGVGAALRGLNGTKAATNTHHSAAENGVTKSTPTMSAETRTLRDRLIGGGGLNGAIAGSRAHLDSSDNSGPRGLGPMADDITTLKDRLADLNGMVAVATYELHAKVFADAQAKALIDNPILLNQKLNAGAEGGYFNKPTSMLIGEAGPEVLLPLSDMQRSIQLLSRYAPGLLGAPASNKKMALGRSAPNGPVTGLNIEHATFQSGTDADLVAARIRTSLRLLGVT
jgi:hypothetical protein